MLELKNIYSFTDEYINMMLYYIEKNKEELIELSKLEEIINNCNGDSRGLLKCPLNLLVSIFEKYFKYDAIFLKDEIKKASYIEQKYEVFSSTNYGRSQIERRKEFLDSLYTRLINVVKSQKEVIEKTIKSNRNRIEQATVFLDKIKDGKVNEIITPYDLLFLNHMFELSKYDSARQLKILEYIFKCNLLLQTKNEEKTEETLDEQEKQKEEIVEENIQTTLDPFLTPEEEKNIAEILESLNDKVAYVDRLRNINDPLITLAENYKQSYNNMENRRDLLNQLSNDLSELVIIISIQELIEELKIWEDEYYKGENPVANLQEKEEILTKLRNYNRDHQILRQNIRKQYIEEKGVEEIVEELQPSAKKLIYLTTGHKGTGNVCFEMGLKEISEEYYTDIAEMLKELKDGVIYNNPEKDKAFPDIKGYRERKEFKIRIIYRLLFNDTILIVLVLPKKENHSKNKINIIKDKLSMYEKEINYIKGAVGEGGQEAEELYAISEAIHKNVITKLLDQGRGSR